MPAPAEVVTLDLTPQWSLAQACILGAFSLVAAPSEVAGSGLLQQMSMSQAWSCGGH